MGEAGRWQGQVQGCTRRCRNGIEGREHGKQADCGAMLARNVDIG